MPPSSTRSTPGHPANPVRIDRHLSPARWQTLTVGPMVGLMLVYVAWRKGGCAEEPELREPPRCWLGDCGETAGVCKAIVQPSYTGQTFW